MSIVNERGTIHVDRPLSDLSVMFKNSSFIADLVSPRVNVVKDSDTFFTYGKQSFQTENDVRSDKAEIAQALAWSVSGTTSYACVEHALMDYVSDRERRNADAPLDPDNDLVDGLTNKLLLGREKRVASLFTTTAGLPSGHYTTLTGTDQWSSGSLSAGSIEEDIDAGKEVVRAAIGLDPNVIIIPAAVSKVVKRNSSIRELIKYTQNDLLVNGDLPPTMFNMRVLIPGAIKQSSAEGQTFTGADVWGKDVVLAYVSPNPKTPRTMTATVTFQSQPRQVEKWREDKRKCDAISVSEIIDDEKFICNYCVYTIKAAIA